MDCPSEENDIRRALGAIEGIRSLGFQLSARTLSIDAGEDAIVKGWLPFAGLDSSSRR